MFQFRLDSATLARVRLLLAALISDAEDVIHIYPICSSCADHADILGAAIALDDAGCVGECGEGLVALSALSVPASTRLVALDFNGSRCIVLSVFVRATVLLSRFSLILPGFTG